MFHTIPVALSIPISSKGDWIAFNAASLALVFPSIQKRSQKINFKFSRIYERKEIKKEK